jgi:hypothetical protein
MRGRRRPPISRSLVCRDFKRSQRKSGRPVGMLRHKLLRRPGKIGDWLPCVGWPTLCATSPYAVVTPVNDTLAGIRGAASGPGAIVLPDLEKESPRLAAPGHATKIADCRPRNAAAASGLPASRSARRLSADPLLRLSRQLPPRSCLSSQVAPSPPGNLHGCWLSGLPFNFTKANVATAISVDPIGAGTRDTQLLSRIGGYRANSAVI